MKRLHFCNEQRVMTENLTLKAQLSLPLTSGPVLGG